jgi:hypothetical protein
MSPLMPLLLAATATLLIILRVRRLAARPPRRYWGNVRHRALAEGVAAAITVLLVGWIAARRVEMPAYHMGPAFTVLALGICFLQYRKTLHAQRAFLI